MKLLFCDFVVIKAMLCGYNLYCFDTALTCFTSRASMVHLADLKLITPCTVLEGTAEGIIPTSGMTLLWVLQECVCE